jgi:hypothetical protein
LGPPSLRPDAAGTFDDFGAAHGTDDGCVVVPAPLLGLTGADCERLTGGTLAEPINAWSSLAFLVAGVWIASRGRRAPGRRLELAVFGVAVASNALGGLLLHGVQGSVARWVHDVSILSVLLFIAAVALARLAERSTGWTMGLYAASFAAAAILLAAIPSAAYPLFAGLGLAVGVFELGEYRREFPALRVEGLTARRVARLSVLAALALAGTAFFLGRTGGPWCRPESALQWHAAWHVLAAAAMALYAFGAIEPHPAVLGRGAGMKPAS